MRMPFVILGLLWLFLFGCVRDNSQSDRPSNINETISISQNDISQNDWSIGDSSNAFEEKPATNGTTIYYPYPVTNRSKVVYNRSLDYSLNSSLNETGLLLTFSPSLPFCDPRSTVEACMQYSNSSNQLDLWNLNLCNGNFSETCIANTYDNVFLTQSHYLGFEFSNSTLAIVSLVKDGANEQLIIGKEIYYDVPCQGELLNISEESYQFVDQLFSGRDDDYGILVKGGVSPQVSYDTSPSLISHTPGELKVVAHQLFPTNNAFLYIWRMSPPYTFGCKWIAYSVFSDIFDMSDPVNDVSRNWENVNLVWAYSWDNNTGALKNETVPSPALKSIFIPRTSPIFERIISK